MRSADEAGKSFLVAILIIVIICFTLVLIDFARLRWIRSSLKYSLSEALKLTAGDPRLAIDIWKPGKEDHVRDFQDARAALERVFLDLPQIEALDGAVTFAPVTHNDPEAPDAKGIPSSIAYLPPGYTAEVGGLQIANSHVVKNGAAFARYPTELVAFAEVNTFFFGRKIIEVRASGEPRTTSTGHKRPDVQPEVNLLAPAASPEVPDLVVINPDEGPLPNASEGATIEATPSTVTEEPSTTTGTISTSTIETSTSTATSTSETSTSTTETTTTSTSTESTTSPSISVTTGLPAIIPPTPTTTLVTPA